MMTSDSCDNSTPYRSPWFSTVEANCDPTNGVPGPRYLSSEIAFKLHLFLSIKSEPNIDLFREDSHVKQRLQRKSVDNISLQEEGGDMLQ